MKRNFIKFSVALLLPLLFLTGCSKQKENTTPTPTPIPLDYNHITWQTDDVDSISERELKDDTFYIEHTRENGTKEYFPLGSAVSSGSNLYYLAGTENIPTLFLTQGDRIIYHSYDDLLLDIYFARWQDLGYTIGIHNIGTMANGRCILGTEGNVLPVCTDAGFLAESEAATILIDEMGKVIPEGYMFGTPAEDTKTCVIEDDVLVFYDGLEVTTTRNLADYNTKDFDPENPDFVDIKYNKLTADNVKQGILYGLEKDSVYHLEYYSGTYYDTSDMTANIHIYTTNEYYHTFDYEVLQANIFEVILPDVLKDGIYTIGTALGGGFAFRLISTPDYAITDTFDDFLFPTGLSGCYSEVDGYNFLQVSQKLEDVTLNSDPTDISDEATGYYFDFTLDEGTSWYYRDGDVEIGRIAEGHKEYIYAFPECTLITVQDIYNQGVIISLFNKDSLEQLNYSEEERTAFWNSYNYYTNSSDTEEENVDNDAVTNPFLDLITTPTIQPQVYINVYDNADILFGKDSFLYFYPTSGIDRFLVLNASYIDLFPEEEDIIIDSFEEIYTNPNE